METNNSKFKIKHSTLIAVVCLLVVSSCLWQKRVYNKGYYVSKNHALKKPEDKTNTDTMPSLVGSITPVKIKEVPVTLSAEIPTSKATIQHLKFKIQPSTLPTDACDTLFLKNGAKILVKITQVYANQVAYTYCNAPNETPRTMDKVAINYIVYANGHQEEYGGAWQQQTQTSSTKNTTYKSHTLSPTTIAGLVFLIVGIILVLLLYAALASPASISSGIGCLAVLGAFFGILFVLTGIILLIIALVNALSA